MKQLPIKNAEVWAVPVPKDANDEQIFIAVFDAMPLGKKNIMGCVTKDLIDFDAVSLFDNADGMLNNKYALCSAIEAAGYYFENPLGRMPSTIDHEFYDEPYDGTGFYQELYSNKMVSWQAAQQNVIEKLVILKKREPAKSN